MNIDARPEFASRNGTGIERLRTEPLVQQEGVYIALSPESMMVIILTTKLEFLNMSLIQKGTKGCAIHCTSFFQFFSCSSLFSACAPFPALILLLWRTLTVDFWHKTFHIIQVLLFYPFIIIFHQIFSSIKILIFLYICFKLHLFDYDLFRKADKGVSFGNRQWILSVVSYKTFTRNVFEWMSNFHLAVFMVSFNFFPFAPAILVVFSSITKPAKSIITQFF